VTGFDRDQGARRRCRYIVANATKQEVAMRAVKYILISLSLLVGVSFFYAGMGIDIPEVQYGDVTSYGVPVGITFIVLAVLLAGFWADRPESAKG
jgi:hypothetical protein